MSITKDRKFSKVTVADWEIITPYLQEISNVCFNDFSMDEYLS